MATSTTGFPLGVTTLAHPEIAVRSNRRLISPEAGRALELLGHAIEYLTDEYVHEGKSLCAEDAPVKAIQLLMSLNRQIYLECPVVPSAADRIRAFFLKLTC